MGFGVWGLGFGVWGSGFGVLLFALEVGADGPYYALRGKMPAELHQPVEHILGLFPHVQRPVRHRVVQWDGGRDSRTLGDILKNIPS